MPDDQPRLSVERELGAITVHLSNVDTKLGELVEQAKITNGTVRQHEIDIAVLKDRENQNAELKAEVTELKARPARWFGIAGVPVLAAVIAVVLQHAF